MKIEATFDSFEEMEQFCRNLIGKDAEPKKDPAPKEGPKQDPAPEPEPEPAPVVEVDENYRANVRKKLAALNKKTGENRASALIKEVTGAESLKAVELNDLPGLMARVEEELNNAG